MPDSVKQCKNRQLHLQIRIRYIGTYIPKSTLTNVSKFRLEQVVSPNLPLSDDDRKRLVRRIWVDTMNAQLRW